MNLKMGHTIKSVPHLFYAQKKAAATLCCYNIAAAYHLSGRCTYYTIPPIHCICALIFRFTAQSASSSGQVKEGSQMALFSFISLSMRLPFSLSRTSPYATLHNLPAIWCKSGVVVGVVDFRPKCPVYRSDLQRNGLWLPWWLPRKSPSWC